jgi:hypothetical protein
MKELTIFTSPKPFTNPHIITIQRNAIRSWKALGEQVEILLIGDDPGVKEAAAELEVKHISGVACNDAGTPLISSIFALAREHSQAKLLAYVNADILVMQNFLSSAQAAAASFERFLLVGRRWDLEVKEELPFGHGWETELRKLIQANGKLHRAVGSDYFIYSRECFTEIPNFAVGRAGWDNWMIFHARWKKWAAINATQSISIVHQSHDYHHLPNGRRHIHAPESFENRDMAGGRMVTQFRLRDCSHEMTAGVISKFKITHSWKRFKREIEIFPLVGLNSYVLGSFFYALANPMLTLREVRKKYFTKANTEQKAGS